MVWGHEVCGLGFRAWGLEVYGLGLGISFSQAASFSRWVLDALAVCMLNVGACQQ